MATDHPEVERERAAKREAQRFDREVLTPLAAATLFGKSSEAIRKAVRNGHVEVVFDLGATDRDVSMIRLTSAVRYWGTPDDRHVDEMRENGHVLSVSGLGYNILHPKPLLTLRNLGALD